ncbi:MAG: aminoacyl-tRNA hydrolase, partial [Deltaproteobacteria bacterium]|nr:aminoacyl-tRNA hydrolase [Deltaproteobacteria bacterium]
MKLVVGLGNPGPQYADTRHNVGFRVVEHMAEAMGLAFVTRADGWLARGTLPGEDGSEVAFALLEPGTFMNRSGGPVSAALAELGITDPARDLLVVYDDLDLPTARLRIRKKGGAGGHNGLGDILAALDTRDVPRIRFGVGRPAEGVDAVDHVLAPFERAEEAAIDAGVAEAAEAARAFLTHGIDVAMNRFNSSSRELGAADRGGRKSEGQPVQSPAAARAEPPPAHEPSRSPLRHMPEAPQPLAQRIARPFV